MIQHENWQKQSFVAGGAPNLWFAPLSKLKLNEVYISNIFAMELILKLELISVVIAICSWCATWKLFFWTAKWLTLPKVDQECVILSESLSMLEGICASEGLIPRINCFHTLVCSVVFSFNQFLCFYESHILLIKWCWKTKENYFIFTTLYETLPMSTDFSILCMSWCWLCGSWSITDHCVRVY